MTYLNNQFHILNTTANYLANLNQNEPISFQLCDSNQHTDKQLRPCH